MQQNIRGFIKQVLIFNTWVDNTHRLLIICYGERPHNHGRKLWLGEKYQQTVIGLWRDDCKPTNCSHDDRGCRGLCADFSSNECAQIV